MNEDICIICFEKNESENVLLNCKHFYHKSCIRSWIEISMNNKCCLCKRKISYFDIYSFKNATYYSLVIPINQIIINFYMYHGG